MSSTHRQLDLFALTRELIDIPSVSGEEAAVAQFLSQLLSDLGNEVELQQLNSDHANVIARQSNAPALFLSTHMDTVPPFIPCREDDQFIYGRGSCDAKGIIAAQICAAEQLRAEGSEIGLLFTVEEETLSQGAKFANTHRLAKTCRYLINGEPTDNRLAVGSKGTLQVTIRTRGLAAHSAYPEHGESAIDKLLDVLADLRKIHWPVNETFGDTTNNIGILSGGLAANVVAPEASAVLRLRLTTEAGPVKQLVEKTVAGRAEIEFSSEHNPQRMLAVDGFEQTIVRFTTDIPYLSNWGEPLLIGPGSILDAHTANERVKKSELLEAVELYCKLARLLLNR